MALAAVAMVLIPVSVIAFFTAGGWLPYVPLSIAICSLVLLIVENVRRSFKHAMDKARILR